MVKFPHRGEDGAQHLQVALLRRRIQLGPFLALQPGGGLRGNQHPFSVVRVGFGHTPFVIVNIGVPQGGEPMVEAEAS